MKPSDERKGVGGLEQTVFIHKRERERERERESESEKREEIQPRIVSNMM